MKMFDEKIITIIKKGGIGILPTDTLFGLVGSAFSIEAVQRIHKMKDRKSHSPFIILISSEKDLQKFGIKPDEFSQKFFKKNWPGKVSVVLPCQKRKFAYLHMDTKSLAFRLPKSKSLIDLIKKTGPLIAPSANPEGKKPAGNITEAKKYFGREVDFYVSGKTSHRPSTLVKIEKKKVIILREGAEKIK